MPYRAEVLLLPSARGKVGMGVDHIDHPHPALPPCYACRRNQGFTMIEAVVAILLMSILALAAIPLISGGVEAYQTTSSQVVTLSKLRYATERIAREIRAVRRNPGTPANYDITTLPGTNVVFTKADGNQVTINGTPPLVTVAYQIPAASATLTDQVSALAFRFLDINGNVTGSAALVAFVEVSLALTVDGAVLQQRTRVGLRALQRTAPNSTVRPH